MEGSLFFDNDLLEVKNERDIWDQMVESQEYRFYRIPKEIVQKELMNWKNEEVVIEMMEFPKGGSFDSFELSGGRWIPPVRSLHPPRDDKCHVYWKNIEKNEYIIAMINEKKFEGIGFGEPVEALIWKYKRKPELEIAAKKAFRCIREKTYIKRKITGSEKEIGRELAKTFNLVGLMNIRREKTKEVVVKYKDPVNPFRDYYIVLNDHTIIRTGDHKVFEEIKKGDKIIINTLTRKYEYKGKEVHGQEIGEEEHEMVRILGILGTEKNGIMEAIYEEGFEKKVLEEMYEMLYRIMSHSDAVLKSIPELIMEIYEVLEEMDEIE